jgi:alkylation response protein AidB-like acyl-CoA dehydrogenase
MWPAAYGGTPPAQVDMFHDLIMLDELARCGGSGVMWGPFFSFSWALPPVLNYGTQQLKDRIARDIVTGKKLIALAVSEPYVGSDVAGMRSTAKKEGDYWVING